MEDMELNPVNAEQEQVVDVPETTDEEEEIQGESEAEQEEASTDSEAEEEQEPAKPAQSVEDNAKFAAMRRQIEKQQSEVERLRKAAEKAEEYRRALTGHYGYTGDDDEIIANLEAAAQKITPEQYKAQKAAEQQLIEQRIQNDPRVKKAQEMEIQQSAFLKMATDLAAIKAAYPEESGATLDDIANSESVVEMILRGYKPADAYYLANRDVITGKKANAAKQAALNAQSKDHLSKIGGSAGGNQLPEIPKSELLYYKEAFPDDSMEKLKQRYKRILQRQGE